MNTKSLLTALALTLPLAGAKAQPWSTNDLPPGLVAWWQAEGNMLDSAGPHDGGGSTAPTYGPGRFGQAFQFNGVDQSVQILDGYADSDGAGTQITGTLKFGLNSPTVFGRVSFTGQAVIHAIVSAAIDNPTGLSTGNSLAVLNHSPELAISVVFGGRNPGNGLVDDPISSAGVVTLELRAAMYPTPPVLSLSYAPQLPAFVLMEGAVDPSYRLLASTNLTTWTALETNSAPAVVWEFSDPAAPNFSRRFYRAGSVVP